MKADIQIENKALDKVNLFIQSNLRVLLTFIFIGSLLNLLVSRHKRQ